jgi:hypothetical protein
MGLGKDYDGIKKPSTNDPQIHKWGGHAFVFDS